MKEVRRTRAPRKCTSSRRATQQKMLPSNTRRFVHSATRILRARVLRKSKNKLPKFALNSKPNANRHFVGKRADVALAAALGTTSSCGIDVYYRGAIADCFSRVLLLEIAIKAKCEKFNLRAAAFEKDSQKFVWQRFHKKCNN